jgi:hypothetical protein
MSHQISRKKSPQRIFRWPLPYKTYIYFTHLVEDDMMPWFLSDILIQRLYQNRQSALLGVLHQPAELGHAGVTLSGKILHQTKSSSI